MQLGTGVDNRTNTKTRGSKYKMTYIRTYIYLNKQTSPIFDCITPVSVSLAKKNGEDSKSNRKVLVGKEAVVSMCYGRLLSSSNFLLLLQSSGDDWIHK